MEKDKINIAILTEHRNSFREPMSLGLSEMLIRLGIKHTLFFEGLEDITYCRRPSIGTLFFYKLKKKILKEIRFLKFVFRLREFNIVVLVAHMPSVFYRDLYLVKRLRFFLKGAKMINYDLHYLGKDPESQTLLIEGGHYGIDHFDGYLLGSINNLNENTLPNSYNRVVGFSFLYDTLLNSEIPAKENFVLIDFERKESHLKNLNNTNLLKQILINKGIEFLQLEGNYEREDLIRLFRRSKLFFMTSQESFGLSLIEAQLSGNYIFTPSLRWPMAHIDDDSRLTANFVVYEPEDIIGLEKLILDKLATHETGTVINRINSLQDHFCKGEIGNLDEFLRNLD
ncbi:MAG: hypothetical protein NTW54_03215 [Bacteroidetes bacterium]|nr:hypothetical protein [Bacteroidota bacterium]